MSWSLPRARITEAISERCIGCWTTVASTARAIRLSTLRFAAIGVTLHYSSANICQRVFVGNPGTGSVRRPLEAERPVAPRVLGDRLQFLVAEAGLGQHLSRGVRRGAVAAPL